MTRSTSNLRVPTVVTTAGSSLAYNVEVLASSSSSINNVDMSDCILVPEPEADVDTIIEQQNAVGQMGATADDEGSKENLRAKLRSTLSKKQSLPGAYFGPSVAVPLSVIALLAKGVVDRFGFSQMLESDRGRKGGRRS